MGFISIERTLFDHWIWKGNEPFDKRSAWVDLIGMAAYVDHEGKDYQGRMNVLKRGEIHTSMLYLAERWKWDRRKVKRFLECLQRDSMLSFHSTTNGTQGGTVIILENYDFYQRKRTKDGTTDGMYHSTDHSTTDGTYHNKGNKENNQINNSINNNNNEPEQKNGWDGQWTYADPDTGRIRFDIAKARKDRGI